MSSTTGTLDPQSGTCGLGERIPRMTTDLKAPAPIVVVGSINADLTVHVHRHPLPGETLLSSGTTLSPGGKGANQAVAAARLGATVSLIGAVGNDAYADLATAQLIASGVNTDTVSVVPDATGLAVITVDGDGENTIVVVPGANSFVDQPMVESLSTTIAEAQIVVLQGEVSADAIARTVELARGRVVINLAPVIPVDRDALLAANPLVANQHEADMVLRLLGVSWDSALHTPEETIQTLRAAGFASVVLTLGGAGSIVADGTSITPIPAAEVEPVDTVGAGDAYVGALVAGLAQGKSLVAAAITASRVSAYSVTHPGAQSSYPWADTILPELPYYPEED